MTTLHMETDAVRAMANQLRQAVEAMRSQTQALNSSAQSVEWLGPSHDEFVMETEAIVRQLDAEAERGTVLAGRVENEVIEWMESARAFGDGSALTPQALLVVGQNRQKLQEKWDSMDFDARKKWLEDWYKNLCKKWGMSPVDFKVEDLADPEGKDWRGVYNTGIIFGLFRAMTVDIDNVKADNPLQMLDTIAHETEHQYQHYLVEHPDKRPDNISEEQIKSWKENFDNYHKSEDDFEAYQNQPVEKNAREVGEHTATDYLAGNMEVI